MGRHWNGINEYENYSHSKWKACFAPAKPDILAAQLLLQVQRENLLLLQVRHLKKRPCSEIRYTILAPAREADLSGCTCNKVATRDLTSRGNAQSCKAGFSFADTAILFATLLKKIFILCNIVEKFYPLQTLLRFCGKLKTVCHVKNRRNTIKYGYWC